VAAGAGQVAQVLIRAEAAVDAQMQRPIARGPLRGGQRRERLQRPVTDQREQSPLDVGPVAAQRERLRDCLLLPQPAPECVEHERAAERPRVDHHQPLARRLACVRRSPSV
jgi:hypothetical protein